MLELIQMSSIFVHTDDGSCCVRPEHRPSTSSSVISFQRYILLPLLRQCEEERHYSICAADIESAPLMKMLLLEFSCLAALLSEINHRVCLCFCTLCIYTAG